MVGSIKTNIGHLEGAAGLAAVIKTIFALEKGIIPSNLWFDKANPRIPMEEFNIRVRSSMRKLSLQSTHWIVGSHRIC